MSSLVPPSPEISGGRPTLPTAHTKGNGASRHVCMTHPRQEIEETLSRYVAMREQIDEGNGTWTDLLEFFTDDMVYIDPAWGRIEGADNVRTFMVDSMAGLDDWKFPIEFTAIEGDDVVVKWTEVIPKPDGTAATQSGYSRLIYAGNAVLTVDDAPARERAPWQIKLHLESAGMVSKLYHLDDTYLAEMDDQFCAASTNLDAMERNRHHETNVRYDRARGKASYIERDLLKNTVIKTAESEIPPCVSDIIGALYKLRTLKLEPGHAEQIAISDGKKTVSVRIDPQAREVLKIKSGTFNVIRCEANIFNGVLYNRKGDFLVWLTDDARHLPVQIRARMSFPIGSITLEIDKEERL